MSIKQTQATGKPTARRPARKRRTKASEQSQTNLQSSKRMKTETTYSDPNASVFDVTLTSLTTSQPVITSTPKRAARREKLWRPWLPTELEVAKYKLKLHRRHRMAPTQNRGSNVHPGYGCHGYPQHPQHTMQQDFPSPAFRNGPPSTPMNRCRANPSPNHMQDKRTWSPAVQVNTGFEFFKQPVKLMWPKSKAHDYMFQEGQKLLKQLPFQAAIGLYDDTDSDASEPNEAFMTSHSFAMNKNFVNNLAAVRN